MKFAMRGEGVLVPVLVMHAALQVIEWSPPGSSDYLARFKKHRDRLERIADKKYLRGQIEGDGSIIVLGSDVQVASEDRPRRLIDARPSRTPTKGSPMHDTSRMAYLFQCYGEDLYAVSHDVTGRNIPRSSCTQGWRLCEEFQLGLHAPVPAPIMAETILKGIAGTGYYVWRGWSGGSFQRPAP